MTDPADSGSGTAPPEATRNRQPGPSTLDAIGDGVYRVDGDGRIVEANDALASLAGVPRERIHGATLSALFGEADRERLAERLERGDGALVRVGLESEGGVVPCELRLTPTEDGHVGVVRDVSKLDRTGLDADASPPDSITDRKRSEGSLRDTEEQFRSLVDAVGEYAIFRLDPDGHVISWNEGAHAIKGYDADEILGEHFSAFYTPEDREAGVPETNLDVATREGSVEDEGWRLRKDGSRFWANVTITAVRDDDGSHRGYLKVTRDMTDRHRRERELESELERMLGRISDVFYAVDEEYRFTHVNERAAELLGYSEEALEGTVMWKVLPDAPDLYEGFERALTTQEPVSFERYFEPLDIWAEVNVYPSESGLSVYLLDVTERKEREQALQRTERRFEAMFEDPNILVGLLSPDGTVLDINETAMEYVDADLADVQGEPFWETPWWGTDESIRTDVKQWTERAAAGDYVDFEADITGPDEVVNTISGFFRPVVDDDGEVVSIVVSDRDVTERKEHERQLEKSEQRYRALVENFPNGIVTLFDQDLRYELAAGQGFDEVPVAQDELEGKHFRDVWGEEVANTLEPAFQAALDGEERSVELTYAGREWVFRAVPITDEAGEVFAGMTLALDITERKERERYLEDVKSRLEAATEAGAVGTWEWHIPEDEMIVGESFAETFGIAPEAAREGVSLDRFVDAVHEDDRERVEVEIQTAIDTCEEYEAEYRVRNADGEYRWVVARGHVETENGEVARFVGALTDITERKRAELELQRNNEQLEALFEVLPVGVLVAEADGELVSANGTAQEIWGGDIFDAGSVEEYGEYPAYWADSGERVGPEGMTLARVLDGESVTDPDVFEIEAADGERRIIEAKGRPIYGDDGEVVRGVATISDVTERHETQRKLRQSERRYRTLVESFPDGAVAMFDENLEYTAVGGQLVDEVGVDREDRIGQSVEELYPDDIVDEVNPHFEAALDGETDTFDIEFHDRHLQATTLPVRDGDGDIFAGMLVVQDITERHEYQRRLEKSNERLEQFAYSASHDLQEPLRMVSSYLQLIQDRYGDVLDEEGEEFLEFAVDGADRMKAMIEGLLAYSRVETRGDPFEPTDLERVLSDVHTDLQFRTEESDAEIESEPLPTVAGDEDQLRQVFQNLIDNAIEYSGDDAPRIQIGAEREGDRWRIDVADDGIGISPEDQERVFEVFQRLHTRSDHEGTGIGLSLVERIVERHGGEIRVDSEPGEGATFSFTLPVSDEEAEASA